MAKRIPSKAQFWDFRVLWGKFVSYCYFSKQKSVFLQILHHSSLSWKITPLCFFSSRTIYVGEKEPIEEKIFETFKCSGQNSLNSSCQFWNYKSVPLKCFHHFTVSSHISYLHIFSSCIFYLLQKDPTKVPVLRLLGALVKIFKIPHVIFETASQFFLKFCITLQCLKAQLLCTFSAEILYTFNKRSLLK